MNVQPNVHTGLTPPLHLAHPPHPAPNQIPESELPPGCETGFVVNIPEDIQQHTPECGETTALLGLIRDKGLLSGLDAYLAPHLDRRLSRKKSIGYVWFIQCYSDGIRNTQHRSWYLW